MAPYLRLSALFLFSLAAFLLPWRAQAQSGPVALAGGEALENFGSLTVGQTSATAAFTFQFNAAETVGGVRVLTEGSAEGDFAVSGSANACQAMAYSASSTCTVSVAFTPALPGLRRGAIDLLDAQQRPLLTIYLQGVGLGAQLTFLPGAPADGDPMGLSGPVTAVVADGVGNVYTNEGGGLVRHSANGDAETWISNAGVSCLATDGAGNVYACENGQVAEYAPNGAPVARPVANPPVSGAINPRVNALAVDGAGDLFVAETDPQTQITDIRRVTPDGNSSVELTLDAGESVSSGMAVDAAAKVYVFTSNGIRILRPDGSTGWLASGNFQTQSAAVDPSGTLFFATGALSSPGAAPQAYRNAPLADGQGLIAVNTVAFALNPAGDMVAVVGQQPASGPVVYALHHLARAANQMLPPFPQTMVGQASAPQSLSVENSGNAALGLGEIAVTGPFVLAQSATGQCQANSTLSAGAVCSVTIAFAPQTAGEVSGAVRLSDELGGALVSLTGEGTAPAPLLTFSASTLDFGGITVGSTTQALSVALTNSGMTSVTFAAAPLIAGENASDFAITGDSCGGSLAPGATCAVQVAFTPAAFGGRTATLSFPGVATVSAGVALAGAGTNGTGAALEASFTNYTFGPSIVGQQSAAALLTILNASSEPLALGIPPLEGAAPADFPIVANRCGLQLAAESSCSIALAFAPSAPGVRSALLTLQTSAPGSPITVNLSGSGQAIATLATTSSSQNFGALELGQRATAVYRFAFFAPAEIARIAVVEQGAEGADFILQPGGADDCQSGSYAAGQSCTVAVSFQPHAPGLRAGAVVLEDAQGTALAIAYLYGTGVGPVAPLAAPPGQALGSLPPVVGILPLAVDGNGKVYLGTSVGSFTPADANAAVEAVGPAVSLAVDGAGNLLIVDAQGSLRRRSPSGAITMLTSHPGLLGVAVDGAGDIFSIDAQHVYELQPSGVETTLKTYPVLPGGQISTGPTGGIGVDANGNLVVLTCYGPAVFHPDGSYTAPTGTSCVAGPQTAMAIDAAGKQWTATAGGAWQGVATAADGSLIYLAASTSGNTLYRLAPQPPAGPQAVALVWPTPAPIVYGAPLGAAQLNASAPAPGTFAYSPAAGAVLPAGVHTLAVTFIPADASAYSLATAQVTLTVNPAPVTVALSASASAIAAGSPIMLTGSATSGATGVLLFQDGDAAIGSAALDASGTATLVVSSLSPGAHSLTAAYRGDGNHAGAVSPAVSVEVTSAVATLSPSQGGMALGAGQSSGTLTLTLETPATFLGNVTFRCDGLPASATCAFAPATLQIGSASASGSSVATTQLTISASSSQSATLWVQTPRPGSAERLPEPFSAAIFYLPWGALSLGAARRRRRLLLYSLPILLCGIGCGAGASGTPAAPAVSATPAPSVYSVKVTAVGAGNINFTQTAIITLTVS